MTRALSWPAGQRLVDWLRPATPALLFGLRLWAAVSLALYVAFRLELDDAVWAGTTAAIVCQPTLGASLRRGSARLLGTVVGATAIVLLTAALPQDRVAYLLALALWGAVCGYVGTVLKNAAAYAAALAGYTAVIIASDLFGPTGGVHGDVFMLAINRAAEIWIGIVSATVVLAGTDFGGARQRLAAALAALTARIAAGLAATLSPAPDLARARQQRREVIAQGAALSPAVEEATGEANDPRYHARGLLAAVDGLYAAVSAWRTAAHCLELLPEEQARREAEAIRRRLPASLAEAPAPGGSTSWAAAPSRLCSDSRRGARSLIALPADTPSLRLMADATAEALLGLSRAFDGLVLLVEPERFAPLRHRARSHVPDRLPALITAARVFIAMVATELFWVATAWPSGGLALVFVAIGTILMSPRGDQAYAGIRSFLIGIAVTTPVVGAIKFGVLPATRSFAELALGIGLGLVPFGFLMARPGRLAPVFLGAIVMFVPLLSPANQMTYDTADFYNTVLAIFVGMAASGLAMVLLPLPAPAVRTARLLALTLRDIRRLAVAKRVAAADDWEARLYGRLSALPPQAEPGQISWLATALSVGLEIIRLRRAGRRLDLGPDFAAALEAFAAGRSALVRERLAQVDRRLAAMAPAKAPVSIALRARGSIRSISEALARHAVYFDAEARV
jgi:uncharacterized membrane protein YccC